MESMTLPNIAASRKTEPYRSPHCVLDVLVGTHSSCQPVDRSPVRIVIPVLSGPVQGALEIPPCVMLLFGTSAEKEARKITISRESLASYYGAGSSFGTNCTLP